MSVDGLDEVLREMNRMNGVIQDKIQDGLLASAAMVQSVAVKSIQRGSKSGKVYTRGNISHQASAPGEAPATDAGGLIRGFQIEDAFINQNVVFVLNNSDHAEPLELRMSRPFLFPALESSRVKIMKELAEQIKGVLK